MANTNINGHSVNYDDSHERLRHAVKYLKYTLSKDEAGVFFAQAKMKGGESIHFEDDNRTNLKLKRVDGEYTLGISGL